MGVSKDKAHSSQHRGEKTFQRKPEQAYRWNTVPMTHFLFARSVQPLLIYCSPPRKAPFDVFLRLPCKKYKYTPWRKKGESEGRDRGHHFYLGSTDNRPCDQILCTARDDVFKVHSELPDGSYHSVEGLVSGRLACPPRLGCGGAQGAIHLDLLLQTFGGGLKMGRQPSEPLAIRTGLCWEAGRWRLGCQALLRLLSPPVGWEFRPCGPVGDEPATMSPSPVMCPSGFCLFVSSGKWGS